MAGRNFWAGWSACSEVWREEAGLAEGLETGLALPPAACCAALADRGDDRWAFMHRLLPTGANVEHRSAQSRGAAIAHGRRHERAGADARARRRAAFHGAAARREHGVCLRRPAGAPGPLRRLWSCRSP